MQSSKKIVVLTGAGISAESGLKTFRGEDGLWEGYRIEEVATPAAWHQDPERVLAFYNHRRAGVAAAQPNAAHFALANLQSDYDVQIITQNIDDLHERAGSQQVLHLHGEIFKMRSAHQSELVYDIRGDIQLGDLAEDGAQLRPDIVWFGEPVERMEAAVALVSAADVFVVIGTSLLVYPAAGLIDYVSPKVPAVIIDKHLPAASPANFYSIEKPATEGVLMLTEWLRSL